MKRNTKAVIFIASMVLTIGSLIAIVGPRHHKHWGRAGYCGRDTFKNENCWQYDIKKVPQSPLPEGKGD
jgi:hypothetical protein